MGVTKAKLIVGLSCMLAWPLLSVPVLYPESADAEGEPEFVFGVIADIQYSDEDSRGSRRYRQSLEKLAECVKAWNNQDLDFAINLGDIIDGNETLEASRRDFEKVIKVFFDLRTESYHVLGNHCLEIGRQDLLRDLILPSSYYDFNRNGWRFIVLDSTDISIYGWPDTHDHYKAAKRLLDKNGKLPAYRTWGGAVGTEQLSWLAGVLEQAGQRGERVMVFSHMPLLAEAAGPEEVLWNGAEVLALLERSGRVAAIFGGHHHGGGYLLRNGIHHITVQGMIESPANAYASVRVYRNKLIIDGTGNVPDRTLNLTK